MNPNSRSVWFGRVVGIMTIMISMILIYSHQQQNSPVYQDIIRRLKQIEWGGIFNSGAASNGRFPKMDCNFLGKDLCCSALENVEKKTSQVKHPVIHHCTVTKEYFPSPYELRHLAKAEELAKIPELKERTTKFVDFIESPEEIQHATKWIDRVAVRQPGVYVEENDVDLEYLSRFKVTRKCPNIVDHSWWEYIEPLSVHARHPFGLGECWHPHHRDKILVYDKKAPRASLLSVDFLLLQSQHDLNGNVENSLRHTTPVHAPSNVFLFDGGTSRFDSSLYWFVCVYQQLGFVLDQIFGWEYTLLEPEDFWNHVPVRYVGLYHFFNAPISPDPTARQSPTRLIQQLTKPDDFVTFKLDIDTPSVEIPIVLEILNNTVIHSLLDEFFFELHFRCEVLMDCGWGYGMPETFHGLTLDRPSALKLFRDLRKTGMRAHFWP